jgi:subtilisin family serine protease
MRRWAVPAVAVGLWVCVVVSAAQADERAEQRVRAALAPRSLDGVASRAWPAQPLLDEARAAVGAELVWEREGGTRGAGATVCVVDTGLDLAHEDFRDALGRTRVRWLLDLDAEPRGVHAALERGGGAVWSRGEIDAALGTGAPLPSDREAHGTAVASAAAGDGAGRGAGAPGPHAGIAPEAELVIVSAFSERDGGFHHDDVVRGARFCADPRVSDPARTVILLALGGHDGAHDGTSAYERAIDAVAAGGAAIVVAAGNDAERAVHARGRAVGDAILTFSLRSPGSERDDAVLAVVVRGAREVRASLPGRAPSRWVARGEQSDDSVLRLDATAPEATYVVARGRLAGGDLRIEARAPSDRDGVVDAWLVEAALGEPLFLPRFVGETAQVGHEVTVPATADRAISVGASVSREFLAGEAGGPGLTASADAAGRASYSARGPRVDGAPLPTLIAPGGWMLVALSGDLDPDAADAPLSRARFEQLRRGADRIAFAGTSMAAAVVAGAIALGRASDASRRDDRALLAASARSPSIEALAPYDPRVGAGSLDAARFVTLRRTPRPAELGPIELGCTARAVAPRGEGLQVVVRAPLGGAARVRTRVSGMERSGTRWMDDGFAAVPVELPPLALGRTLVLEAEVGGVLAPACTVTIAEPSGAPPGLAGGCAVAHRRGPSSAACWALCVGCAFARSLRRTRR